MSSKLYKLCLLYNTCNIQLPAILLVINGIYGSWCCADRSGNDRIGTYQEWLKAPDYEGKSEADIKAHTITSLRTVKELLTDVNKC